MRRSDGCKLTQQEWKALCNTDISAASATEQRQRLQGTEHWYQSAPTWATASMAQAIRSRLCAVHAGAMLFIILAKDYVLNRPQNSRLTDAYLVEQIAAVPNMNNTGRLPAIAMLHIGMTIRLTNTVEAPEAVTDSTGEVVGIDFDPDELTHAAEHASTIQPIRILHKLPIVTVKLHNAANTLHSSCRRGALSRMWELRFPRKMYSSRAAALTRKLPYSSAGSRFRRMLHTTGPETTATDDDPNSEHY